MIGLYYHNAEERWQALLSVHRLSEQLDSHLIFIGPSAACSEAHQRIPSLRCQPEGGKALDGGRSTLANLPQGAGMVWMELSILCSGKVQAETLEQHFFALEQAKVPVISAFHLQELGDGALGTLLQRGIPVIHARFAASCCVPCLVDREKAGSSCVYPVGLVKAAEAEKLAALGAFATGIAHEIANPLSIISSTLQHLHERLTLGRDASIEFTAMALQNVERVQTLLRNLLDFAVFRRAVGETLDLNKAVSAVVCFIYDECQRRSITVSCSLDPLLPRVWADPHGIEQILLNVLKNSLEALTEVENREIRIATKTSEDQVLVEIENNGPPITGDVLPFLFRSFQTTKPEGTGLGLYISRQIAMNYGGNLQSANVSRGVNTILTLPAVRREE